jgi:hypothetical protein
VRVWWLTIFGETSTLANLSKSVQTFFALLCNQFNYFTLEFQLKQLCCTRDAVRQGLAWL